MPTEGRVIFGKMDEVVFGKPAAESVAEQTRRLGAERVFLMVSGTLLRETGEIGKIRAALGNRCVGVFDNMPAHTPRSAVVAAAAAPAANMVRLVEPIMGALLLVTKHL